MEKSNLPSLARNGALQRAYDGVGDVVVYYAGLDVHALPFAEADKNLARRGKRALAYAKLLTLFADDVVIPPSFYLEAVRHPEICRSLVPDMAPLYGASLLRSPVHNGLGRTVDFLERKIGNEAEADYIPMGSELLAVQELFAEIPLAHRDVARQSQRFRERVLASLDHTPVDSRSIDVARSALCAIEGKGGVALSRRHALDELERLLVGRAIDRRDYRQLYYEISRSYFLQGSDTYGAAISLPGVARYSIFGREAFDSSERGIAVGYDPELLEVLLGAYGISLDVVAALSPDDIWEIRRSSEYNRFRVTFARFIARIQSVSARAGGVSARQLDAVKQRILMEFHAEYVLGKRVLDDRKQRWGLGETLGWAALLGTLGFFVTPLLGLVLGGVPVLLQATKVTPRLSDTVLKHIDKGQAAFHFYVEYLGAALRRMET